MHLHRHGIRINDPANGVFLVHRDGNTPHWSMPNSRGHLKYHTHEYEQWLAQRIQRLDLTLLDLARLAPENSNPDAVLDFSRENSSLAEWWKAPETRFVANEGVEDRGIPDISTWVGATLVLSPRAYRYLGETLREYGELLPVTVGEETFHIFNCLTKGEEAPEHCEYEMLGDVPVQLVKLAFKESAQSLTVFKSDYEACLTVFCSQRFMDAVEEFKLSGILFDENLAQQF